MCTASWIVRDHGFELFFNRDEARSRMPALPPERFETEGTRYLAPTDADAGGTWLGVNEHGLAVGLLNAWEDEAEPDPPVTSRGALVRELLCARSQAEVEERLAARDLAVFRGFRLLTCAPGAEPRVVAWRGRRLAHAEVRLPLASSGRERDVEGIVEAFVAPPLRMIGSEPGGRAFASPRSLVTRAPSRSGVSRSYGEHPAAAATLRGRWHRSAITRPNAAAPTHDTSVVVREGTTGSNGPGAVSGSCRDPSASTTTWSTRSNHRSHASTGTPSAFSPSDPRHTSAPPSAAVRSAISAVVGSISTGKPSVRPANILVVVVSTVVPSRVEPSANSAVVLPPPPTSDTSSCPPRPSASGNSSRATSSTT